jgi:hypothetical protein
MTRRDAELGLPIYAKGVAQGTIPVAVLGIGCYRTTLADAKTIVCDGSVFIRPASAG